MKLDRYKLLALAALAVSTPGYGTEERRFTPDELRADLAVVETVIRDRHPDISHSASPEGLNRALAEASRALDHPMNRVEAWSILARLNPVFADAHMVVGIADRRGETNAHLAAGGRLFPFEIEAAADGKIYVAALLGGAPTPLQGARILSVNGTSAAEIRRSLMPLMQGETIGFRSGIMARRFAYYHFKLFGESANYDIEVRHNGRRQLLRVAGSQSVPATMADELDFDRAFRFELLPCQSALLTVNSFVWDDKSKFLEFTRNAFAQIRSAGVTSLVIDVRANEGGNDDLWQEGIMPYIATSRYQWASAFKKRVLNPDQSRGERAFDVVAGPLESWREPDLANPLRFHGTTYVLIGQASYSSTVLFANVVRDFSFGRVAGTGGFARADQTGGTQVTTLPNTGLVIVWPRFILTRPSGDHAPEMVEPDVAIDETRFRPRAAVAELLQCPAVNAATSRNPAAL